MFSFKNLFCFILIDITLCCSLSSLYKDIDRQLIVKEHLSNYFEFKYSLVCTEALKEAKYLLPPANHFKKDIKKLFIEYGNNLNTLEELEIILKSFDYLKIEEFRLWKEEWDKYGNQTDILIE